MTGKGVRWGRESVGRSEPAFMAASITALPPLTCTARGRQHRQLLFLLRGWPSAAVVSSRPVPSGESAGCVRLQWFCSADCVPAATLCLPCPLPSSSCPVHFACPRPFCFIVLYTCFMSMCARIVMLGPAVCQGQQFASCENCPVGSCNTGLQWRPVHRSI